MEEVVNELKGIRANMVKQMNETDLLFNSKQSIIKMRLNDPIEVGENGALLGVKGIFMYNSIPNISNNNNHIGYKYKDTIIDIRLESGAYELQTIVTRINDHIRSFNIEF